MTYFKIWDPSITSEWNKLRASNFVHKSTMSSSLLPDQKFK